MGIAKDTASIFLLSWMLKQYFPRCSDTAIFCIQIHLISNYFVLYNNVSLDIALWMFKFPYPFQLELSYVCAKCWICTCLKVQWLLHYKQQHNGSEQTDWKVLPQFFLHQKIFLLLLLVLFDFLLLWGGEVFFTEVVWFLASVVSCWSSLLYCVTLIPLAYVPSYTGGTACVVLTHVMPAIAVLGYLSHCGDWITEESWFDFRQGQEIFLFHIAHFDFGAPSSRWETRTFLWG